MRDEKENQKLAVVKEKIAAEIKELGAGLAVKRAGVLETREEMWREARKAISDFDDVADLSIFADDVARNEREYSEASKEIEKLNKMLDSPYFARIDFTEEGYDELEEIYIGRHSLFEKSANIFHVYDWRAPISSLYYDYGVGPASFTVPSTGAKIRGQVSLKRQYQIEKGKLVYLFDNDLAIEDDILRLELSKASDAHIKTIINTIQTEQNRAIRAEEDVLLVFGPAGSGKTSVGLHRLAYLLYRFRASLTSAKVRIFSPGSVFSSYIEGIIPELGEEDVQTLDFSTLLETAPRERRLFHGYYQQIEHLTASGEHGRPAPDDVRTRWIAQKYSPAFLDSLEKFISDYNPSFEDVIFYNTQICGKKRLEALYQDRTAAGTLASKTERVLSYVNQSCVEYLKANRRTTEELFNNITGENLSDSEIQSKFDEEKNIILSDLRNRLLPPSTRVYERHLRAWAKKSGLPAASARDFLRMEKLYFEDALAVFYIDLLTGRVPGDKTVKHILLDEAQDLSHLHHRILRRLYPTSNFTVLADFNQAIYPEINITKPADFSALYPKGKVVPLTKSYRSTYEIMRFAAGILDQAEPSIFVRHGEEPAILQSQNPVAAVLSILKKLPDEYNTVGILLPTTGEAKAFHKELSKAYPKGNTPRPLQLIAAESQSFAPGIMVMAVPFAKGLEFDTVVCPPSPTLAGPRGRQLLYLICTRALHRLYILCDGRNDCIPGVTGVYKGV